MFDDFVSGRKSAYVQYHMRPHETFREPYRKFFDCELVRSPFYQEIDIDSILGMCCVLDLATYCLVCCCAHYQHGLCHWIVQIN